MTQQPTSGGRGLNLRGAVDLAALAARNQRREQAQQRSAAPDAPQGPALVLDVTEETFADVV